MSGLIDPNEFCNYFLRYPDRITPVILDYSASLAAPILEKLYNSAKSVVDNSFLLGSNKGSSLLVTAITNKRYLNVRFLLRDFQIDPDIIINNGDTPLFLAIRIGDLQIFKMLLFFGAQVNMINRVGITPLDLCSIYNRPEMATILFKKGATNRLEVGRFEIDKGSLTPEIKKIQEDFHNKQKKLEKIQKRKNKEMSKSGNTRGIYQLLCLDNVPGGVQDPQNLKYIKKFMGYSESDLVGKTKPELCSLLVNQMINNRLRKIIN
jgi:hypothetical protein